MLKKAFKPASVLLLLNLASPAQAFQWQEQNATASGTGCNFSQNGRPIDVSFLSNGADFSVVFSNMNIELSNAGQGLRASKDCQLKVPFLLERGNYEGELSETVTIGLIKSENADAKVDFKSRIIDSISRLGNARPFNPMNNQFSRGSHVMEPLLLRSRRTMIGQDPGQRCLLSRDASNEHIPLYYDASLILSATRQDASQEVFLQSDSIDIRLDLSQSLVPCRGGQPVPQPRPTPRPLPSPIPRPTVRPNPQPIPRPTVRPNPQPIPRPTVIPQPRPTVQPIPRPTVRPPNNGIPVTPGGVGGGFDPRTGGVVHIPNCRPLPGIPCR